jgi:hypothetical protein
MELLRDRSAVIGSKKFARVDNFYKMESDVHMKKIVRVCDYVCVMTLDQI